MRTSTKVGLAAIAISAAAALALAHGGGIDGQGGHHDRKNGGYHFHQGPLAGQYFNSKAAGAAALRKHREKPEGDNQDRGGDAKEAPPVLVSRSEFEALKQLLITKRVFTENQYQRKLEEITMDSDR